MGIGRAMKRLKNELADSFNSGSYEFPTILRSCDSFAIDYANKHWDPSVRQLFVDRLLTGARGTSKEILTKFMRNLPHRYLWYCFKARSATGFSSIFFGFLNFVLYCCIGLDSPTLNAGKPSEQDYFQVLVTFNEVLSEIHEEINQAVKDSLVEKHDVAETVSVAAEAESVASEVAKLTLAESSEGQNDSTKAQSGTAKAILKGVIGFGAFIALCSLGVAPHLTPVVTPVINTAVEKAF